MFSRTAEKVYAWSPYKSKFFWSKIHNLVVVLHNVLWQTLYCCFCLTPIWLQNALGDYLRDILEEEVLRNHSAVVGMMRHFAVLFIKNARWFWSGVAVDTRLWLFPVNQGSGSKYRRTVGIRRKNSHLKLVFSSIPSSAVEVISTNVKRSYKQLELTNKSPGALVLCCLSVHHLWSVI